MHGMYNVNIAAESKLEWNDTYYCVRESSQGNNCQTQVISYKLATKHVSSDDAGNFDPLPCYEVTGYLFIHTHTHTHTHTRTH